MSLKRLIQSMHLMRVPESESIILKGEGKGWKAEIWGGQGQAKRAAAISNYFKKEIIYNYLQCRKDKHETNKESNLTKMKTPSQTI